MELVFNENLKVCTLEETEKINGGVDPEEIHEALVFAALCGAGGACVGAFAVIGAYEIWKAYH